MKEVWNMSNFLFGWYWKKGGKHLTLGSVVLAAVILIGAGAAQGKAAFRLYARTVDSGLLPWLFFAGMAGVFFLLLLRMRSFFHDGKGIYTMLTLPVRRRAVYGAFLLAAVAAVALYYLLWLVLLVAAYFPLTAVWQRAAAAEVFWLEPSVTVQGVDVTQANGLFLSFGRSWFLSLCFPRSLWQGVPFLGGMALLLSALLAFGLAIGNAGTRIGLGLLCVLGGGYLLLIDHLDGFFTYIGIYREQPVSPGHMAVLGLVGLAAAAAMQVYLIRAMERGTNV